MSDSGVSMSMTLLRAQDLAFSSGDLREKLESAKIEDKIEALKAVILLALNGEPQVRNIASRIAHDHTHNRRCSRIC